LHTIVQAQGAAGDQGQRLRRPLARSCTVGAHAHRFLPRGGTARRWTSAMTRTRPVRYMASSRARFTAWTASPPPGARSWRFTISFETSHSAYANFPR